MRTLVNNQYIETTQAFLRFYVLAVQYIDYFLFKNTEKPVSRDEVYTYLKEAHTILLQNVSMNRIVPQKIQRELEEINELISATTSTIQESTDQTNILKSLRSVLYNKAVVLSDLLAVLRLIPQPTTTGKE